MSARRRKVAFWLTGMILCLVVALGMLRLHGRSIQRANGLYREGQVERANALYRDKLRRDRAASIAYNTGTSELILQTDSAESMLLDARRMGDSTLVARANYNLGYHYITTLSNEIPTDTAIAILIESIRASREALRIDNDYEDARWNLALAQTMLDSISQQFRDTGRERESGDDDTRIDMDALGRGEGDGRSGIEPPNPERSETVGQRFAASQGAREAWASQDPGPLSEAAARNYIANARSSPEQLIRGLIWAHRPDIEWWNAEPYPGGNQ